MNHDCWNIAIRKGEYGGILSDLTAPFTVLPNGATYWLADPMIFEHEGVCFIFAELYSYFDLKGRIAVAQLRDNGTVSRWKTVISEPFHMSYPFVFEASGKIYMIPETNEDNSLRLYEAVSFPHRWKLVKKIIDGVKWVDTTIFKTTAGFSGFTRAHEDNDIDYAIELDADLNLISAQALHHEDDDKSYRCGGRCISIDGKTIRVCQDERNGYGAGLFFRMANNQGGEAVREIHSADLKTDIHANWVGLHTYTSAGGWEVIDLKSRRNSLLEIIIIHIHRFMRRLVKAYNRRFKKKC